MLAYVTLGTNDLDKAAAFYDELLAEMGAKRGLQTERIIFWYTQPGHPSFAIAKPYDGEPATVGNGVMPTFAVKTREEVDRIYQKALSLGGVSEGEPGQRTERAYLAYFRDLEGNKLAVCAFVKRDA